MSSIKGGDKIRDERSEAAFSKTRTRGNSKLEERSASGGLARPMLREGEGARGGLIDEHITIRVKRTSRANRQTIYRTLARVVVCRR